MTEQLRLRGRFVPNPLTTDVEAALLRFRRFCRHEPQTGCVIWTGSRTMGRGHSVPYGGFKFAGQRWFAHRWAAKYIHGLDIEQLQVDHCCPNRPIPNTLCVEHLQALTLKENRQLQHVRKRMVLIQVGVESYEDWYGCPPGLPELDDHEIPFYPEPAWLKTGEYHGHAR